MKMRGQSLEAWKLEEKGQQPLISAPICLFHQCGKSNIAKVVFLCLCVWRGGIWKVAEWGDLFWGKGEGWLWWAWKTGVHNKLLHLDLEKAFTGTPIRYWTHSWFKLRLQSLDTVRIVLCMTWKGDCYCHERTNLHLYIFNNILYIIIYI